MMIDDTMVARCDARGGDNRLGCALGGYTHADSVAIARLH